MGLIERVLRLFKQQDAEESSKTQRRSSKTQRT